MWRVAVAFGAILWLLTIAASAAMNAFAGYSFGRTPTEGYIFGALGVAADGWKALAPVFLVSLARARRIVVCSTAAMLWIACFTYAVSSALGLAAQNRLAATGARDAVVTSYASISGELTDLKAKRARIGATRSVAEIEAAIGAALAEPVGGRGTVASVSEHCQSEKNATRNACAAIAALRTQLAAAREAQRLDNRIDQVAREASGLTAQGGKLDADPQARVIAAIFRHLVSVQQVGLGLMLSLVTMVELVSAFGPVVLSEFVGVERTAARSRATALCTDQSRSYLTQVGDVFEFMAEKIRPAADGHATIAALQESYDRWCTVRGFAPLPSATFVDEFARICRDELKGQVQRRRHRFEGLTLAGPLLLLQSEH